MPSEPMRIVGLSKSLPPAKISVLMVTAYGGSFLFLFWWFSLSILQGFYVGLVQNMRFWGRNLVKTGWKKPFNCCQFHSILFYKGLEMHDGEWQDPYSLTCIHMYMLCPYVISTLYHLLEELVQMRTFKRYFSCAILLTTLHLREMN
jgi:hypothetical protein